MTDASCILEGLNEAQRNAVTSEASVLQILAPPGSGKTKTLTSRVSWLLFHENCKPWNVICLTFTIKSAREMKERIGRQIGQGLERKLILGTFHSVCLRYLRTYGHLIGLPKGFDIADSSDSQAIIKRIIKQKNLTIDPSTARSRISHNKAKNKSYLDIQLEQKKSVERQEFMIVFEAYQNHLKTTKLLDYDDLLVRCAELLQSHPECVVNVEAVLVDEFQDTNHIQFQLLQLFANHCKRITTVGDPDQSIYGWRSAEIENLKKMQRIYPDTLVLNLENNYRSSPSILRASQAVIEQDDSRPQKTMVATHKGGSVPVLRQLFSPKTQASWIVAEIKRCRAATGETLLSYTDFAILIRSAALSRQIETAMGHAGIPYRMVGGLRFFDRKEVKVLLDYMRVVSHPENNDAIARIINYPARGIGEKSIKMILDKANSLNRVWWDLIVDEMGRKKPIGFKEVTMKGLRVFHDIIATCRKAFLNEEKPKYPLELMDLIIQQLNFETHLEKEFPEDFEQRLANIEELRVQASEYGASVGADFDNDSDALPEVDGIEQAKQSPAQESLTKFLGNIALSTELQSEEELDDHGQPLPKVTISTIHAAKGLEWPVVFIPCVYKGSIPHSRSEDEDEERRLLYVAMTRAQALLYMTYPREGQMNEEYILSPFLENRTVMRCLADRAPSIYSQVSAISSILRRPCPKMEDVQSSLAKIDCIEDDEITWPLDGSKGIGQDGSNFFKPADQDVQGLRHSMTSKATSHSVGGSNACHEIIQSGFVTATSQLKRHQPSEPEKQLSSMAKDVTGYKRARTSKMAPNQPSIGSFFSKTSIDASQRTMISENPIKPLLRYGTSEPLISSHEMISYKETTTSVQRCSSASEETNTRLPLSTITPSLSKHQISRSVGLQRYKSTMDEYQSGGPFMLLSSSPTQSPQLSPVKAGPGGVEAAPPKPVVTNNTTTMSALQQHQSRPRGRTLGISRAFKPWNSTPGTGFQVPKVTRPLRR